MKILSMGWGVQSFTLAAMVAMGELPGVLDYAVHADTGHESKLTYEFIQRWIEWLRVYGVDVVTVRNEKNEVTSQRDRVAIPVYMVSGSKTGGRFPRHCTYEWKVAPLRRWLQSHRNGAHIEQLVGISLDEFQRMRDSDVKYITNTYPLVERNMTRSDCITWLKNNDLEVPPKSACTFCPFHTVAEWRVIQNTPDDWKEAISTDESIRKARPPYDLFIHPSRKPLAEVDLRTEEQKGQMSLWDEECAGICGV